MENAEYIIVETEKGEFYVSPEDKPVLTMCSWSIRGDGYISGSINGKPKLMHTLMMERTLGRLIKPGYVVDHINGIRSDNRRENLREVTRSENGKNKPGCYVVITYSETVTMIKTRKLNKRTLRRIRSKDHTKNLELLLKSDGFKKQRERDKKVIVTADYRSIQYLGYELKGYFVDGKVCIYRGEMADLLRDAYKLNYKERKGIRKSVRDLTQDLEVWILRDNSRHRILCWYRGRDDIAYPDIAWYIPVYPMSCWIQATQHFAREGSDICQEILRRNQIAW